MQTTNSEGDNDNEKQQSSGKDVEKTVEDDNDFVPGDKVCWLLLWVRPPYQPLFVLGVCCIVLYYKHRRTVTRNSNSRSHNNERKTSTKTTKNEREKEAPVCVTPIPTCRYGGRTTAFGAISLLHGTGAVPLYSTATFSGKSRTKTQQPPKKKSRTFLFTDYSMCSYLCVIVSVLFLLCVFIYIYIHIYMYMYTTYTVDASTLRRLGLVDTVVFGPLLRLFLLK